MRRVGQNLEQVRGAALEEVNAAIAVLRLRYLTDLPGQDLLYTEKRSEAVAYLADPDPQDAGYPLLGAEVDAGTVADRHQAAQLILGLAQVWRQVAARMEAVRLAANGALAAAASVGEVEAALGRFRAAVAGL